MILSVCTTLDIILKNSSIICSMWPEAKRFLIVIFLICGSFYNGESQYKIDNSIYPISSVIQQASAEDVHRGTSFVISANKVKSLFKVILDAQFVDKQYTHQNKDDFGLPDPQTWLRPSYYTLLYLYSLF